MKSYARLGLLLAFLSPTAPTLARGNAEDYQRAFALAERFRDRVTHDQVEPHWVSPSVFWYKANLGSGRSEYLLVDAEQGLQAPAFEHAALAAAFADKNDRKIEPDRLDIDKLFPEGDAFLLRIDGSWWTWDRTTLTELKAEPLRKELGAARGPGGRFRRRGFPGRPEPKSESPDGNWRVEQKLGELVLVSRQSDERVTLAAAPDRDGSFAEGVVWSPDSSRFVAWEQVPGDGRIIHLIESSPTDRLQPKLHEQQYDKPGDNVPWRRPRLFSVEDRAEIAIDRTLWPIPWKVDRLAWSRDNSSFTFLYNERGHQTLRLLEVDATDGSTSALIEETSRTFVHYSGLGKCDLRPLPGGDFLWTSERDGWNHLYRLDRASGELQQLTRGPWVVRELVRVDPMRGCVWFYAGGVIGGQDPYYRHLCRVDLDGGNFAVLTSADGDHSVNWSPRQQWFIDSHSRVDLAPIHELRSADDGSLVVDLQRGDLTALEEAGWRAPERFVAKGRDGKTDIYGVVCRPTNFDPEKQYPVVEEHYAGPHSAHCPKRFRTLQRSQAMADLGFIVVRLDGMGTDHRGKAFHDHCWKNLADAGFPDRIAWMRALAAHEPAIDLERVGIRGTSAGGQTGMAALLNFGDFYKACVSNCGCHDNRTDKVWWNEQWMGYPIGPHYHGQSNVTQAHKLEGDLMLIVGEMDRNVPPTATLQVVDALIRADKDFEFLFVPGGGHGARHPANGDYVNRRTWDFFVRKLHGVEPRR